MGLKPGGKVAIWSIDDKGSFAKANLSTQSKDKEGHYFTDWSNKFCNLFGKAYEAVKDTIINEGEHIDAHIGWGYERTGENDTKFMQIPFEVTNKYDKSKGILYTNYAIYDLELKKGSNSGSSESSSSSPKTEQKDEPASNGLVGLDFLNIPDTNALADLPFK